MTAPLRIDGPFNGYPNRERAWPITLHPFPLWGPHAVQVGHGSEWMKVGPVDGGVQVKLGLAFTRDPDLLRAWAQELVVWAERLAGADGVQLELGLASHGVLPEETGA